MNILLITNLFPTPYDPERGVFTLQLVKRLQKHSNVTVICPLPWFPNFKVFNKFKKWSQFSKVPEKYVIDGIEVYSPKYPLVPKLSENIHDVFMSFGISKCIQKLHKTTKFDLINSQWLYPDSVAVDKISRELKIPHVPTGLGCDVNLDIYQKGKGKKILRMLNHSVAITVVSNNLKSELVKNNIPDNKITVIPNGIDISQFKILDKSTCRNSLNIDLSASMVLYVGRLSEEKSVSTLIDATYNLIRSGKEINVYIVGDGPLYEELTSAAKEYGISNYINFIGKINHNDISKWMNAADYLCLPSLREGCPNVILEALGCGIPVIASHVGAIPDVVTADSGILFTPEDVAGLTISLEKALNTNWNAATIRNSVKKLTWENAAENYYNVFSQVIK